MKHDLCISWLEAQSRDNWTLIRLIAENQPAPWEIKYIFFSDLEDYSRKAA